MAVRLLLTNLKRAKLGMESKNHPWIPICNYHRRSQPNRGVEEKTDSKLAREILMLKYPAGCATTVIQNWSDDGLRVSFNELRRFSAKLMKYKRYIHSLQVMDWLESQSSFQMSPTDHAIKTQLLVEVKGLAEAEHYFEKLSDSSSRKASFFPLLRGHVRDRNTSKAETFMAKSNGLGLVLTPHPYNEMMKLYTANSQPKKVSLVIEEMKRNKIPLNVLSYNIWMNASLEISGEIESVERIYNQMTKDRNVEIGWSSLSTLANAYTKKGQIERAYLALERAEKKLSGSDPIGHLFLMTQHAALGNKNEALRLWEKTKSSLGKKRITCKNYVSAVLCFVKLNDLDRAERVFFEWESDRGNYDIRVSNVLLGAYARGGFMERAEKLHRRTLEGGGRPNYKTWEILAEGWVRRGDMGKAVDALRKAFSLSEDHCCDWRPSSGIVMSIAEDYEKRGDVDNGFRFLEIVRGFGFASLGLYKSVLRLRVRSLRPALGIEEMMEIDGIEMDDEARALIRR